MKGPHSPIDNRPCVVVLGHDHERPALEALLAELRTFTMADSAHARVIAVPELPEPERAWHGDYGWALVLDGWARGYATTLGQVMIAAEFFMKAWRHRERQEQARREAQERGMLEKFAAQRVIRARRPGDMFSCYVHRPGRKASAPVLWCHRADAAVFADEAAACAYGARHLAPLAGRQVGYLKDDAWDDFFVVVPADEVPGSWR